MKTPITKEQGNLIGAMFTQVRILTDSELLVKSQLKRQVLIMAVNMTISVKRMLRRNNMDVISVQSAVIGLKELQKQTPDIILLDVFRPLMNGYEFVRIMRDSPEDRIRNIPIIMMIERSDYKHHKIWTSLGVKRSLCNTGWNETNILNNIYDVLAESINVDYLVDIANTACKKIAPLKRILFLDSAMDRIGDDRADAIRTSQALNEYTIGIIYCVERSDLPFPRTEAFDTYGNYGIKLPISSNDFQERLFNRVNEEIKNFAPDLVLVYIGYVFRQFRSDIYEVIKVIKQLHKNDNRKLYFGRFGLRTKPDDFVDDGIFDRSEEILEVERVFWHELYEEK